MLQRVVENSRSGHATGYATGKSSPVQAMLTPLSRRGYGTNPKRGVTNSTRISSRHCCCADSYPNPECSQAMREALTHVAPLFEGHAASEALHTAIIANALRRTKKRPLQSPNGAA